VIAPLATHVRRRNPTQLVVNGSKQLRFVPGGTVAPSRKRCRHVRPVRIVGHAHR